MSRINVRYVLLFVMIVLQLFVMIAFGLTKKGSHVDEMFSYGLAKAIFNRFCLILICIPMTLICS